MTLIVLILNVMAHLMIYCDQENSASDSNNTNNHPDDSSCDSTYFSCDLNDNNSDGSNSTSDYHSSSNL